MLRPWTRTPTELNAGSPQSGEGQDRHPAQGKGPADHPSANLQLQYLKNHQIIIKPQQIIENNHHNQTVIEKKNHKISGSPNILA